MTDEQLKALKAELDEVVALRDNLKSTQERCTELIQETRAKDKRITELEKELELVRKLLVEHALGPEVKPEEPRVTFEGLPELDGPIDPFDNNFVMDGTQHLFDKPVDKEAIKKSLDDAFSNLMDDDDDEKPAEPKVPFPSPHKQPPFQPVPMPSNRWDRRVALIDSAGRTRPGRGRID